MKRFLIIFFSLACSFFTAAGQQSHVTDTNESTYDEYITFLRDAERIESEIIDFYNECKAWDNGIIRDQVGQIGKLNKEVRQLITSLEKGNKELEKEFCDAYNKCILLYNEISFARTVLQARAEKEKEWETTYFGLWEKILDQKEAVEQLYQEKQVNTGSRSIGYDRETMVIRKRRLYYAWNDIYDAFLLDMKRTQQYEARIEIENKILTLLDKAEDLAFATTRDLEKQLKKTSDLLIQYEMIIRYQAE